MKILIVGAGVAGCAFAGFCDRYNLGDVTLVERTDQLGNMGYLIALWGNGRRILKELGLEREIVDKYGEEITSGYFEDRRGKVLKAVSFESFRELGVNVALSRSALQQGLTKILGKNLKVKLRTIVTSLEQKDNKVEAEFGDLTSDKFDLVVGADGINSSVRELVFGAGFKQYYNSGIWAYWLPKNSNLGREWRQVRGNRRSYAVSPMRGQTMVWFTAPMPPGKVTSPEQRAAELRRLFMDFNEEARKILQGMPNPEHIFYDDMAYIKMPLWYKGRGVLTGDAQHAMSPSLGMGASLALEDAFVLADELRKNTSDIQTALQNYSHRRQKRLKEMRAIQARLGSASSAEGLRGKLVDILISLMPASFFLTPMRKFVAEKI